MVRAFGVPDGFGPGEFIAVESSHEPRTKNAYQRSSCERKTGAVESATLSWSGSLRHGGLAGGTGIHPWPGTQREAEHRRHRLRRARGGEHATVASENIVALCDVNEANLATPPPDRHPHARKVRRFPQAVRPCRASSTPSSSAPASTRMPSPRCRPCSSASTSTAKSR